MNKMSKISAAVLVGLAGSAQADLSDTALEFSFQDSVSGEVSTWSVAIDRDEIDSNGDYNWGLDAGVDVLNNAGEVVMTINTAALTIFADPVVDLNFNVVAGAQNGIVTVTSTELSFAAIPNAIGSASAAVSVTDFLGDGVTLTGASAGGGAYSAYYNGLATGGTEFASLISGVSAGGGQTNSASADFPLSGTTIVGPSVSSISSQWVFSLSAFDLASGTSTFTVVPAPATALLVGLGGIAAIRRR